MSNARKLEALIGGLGGGAIGLTAGSGSYKTKDHAGIGGEMSNKDRYRKNKYKGVGTILGTLAGGLAAPRYAKHRIQRLLKQDKELAKKMYGDVHKGVKSRLDNLTSNVIMPRDRALLRYKSDKITPLISRGLGVGRDVKEALTNERLRNIRKGSFFGGRSSAGKKNILKDIFGRGPVGSDVEETLKLRYDTPVKEYISKLIL